MTSKIRARIIVVVMAIIGAGVVLAGPSHADDGSPGGGPVSTNGYIWSN
ncbi:hypothetical protein [Nonomuraea rubra]|uniref:Uncharacterized protein n=1 Tax=Nonomuraea rubra TaxID=46180 RepID=A0A7X0P7T3_9ACTN|nr:hypothetical protein [Nonomuraea rubra]